MSQQSIHTAIAGHYARNKSLKEVLLAKQVDLREPRNIECHFWSASQADARELTTALQSRGFTIIAQQKASNADAAMAWNIEARITQSVDLTTRHEFTEDLVTLADAHNSRYDGWGTSI